MADKTAIGWTDTTWNVVVGCRRLSEGCRHCYAERLAATRLAHQPKYAGLAVMHDRDPRWTGEARVWRDALDQVVRWTRPRRVFTTAMGDLFYDAGNHRPQVDLVYAFMAISPQHQHQNLTKRPDVRRVYLDDPETEGRVRAIVEKLAGLDVCEVMPEWRRAENEGTVKRVWFAAKAALDAWRWPLPNMIEMTSVEDQATADERIPELLATRCAMRGVSYEPALGPVDFTAIQIPGEHRGLRFNALRVGHDDDRYGESKTAIDWIIFGGESGSHARPCDVAWGRAVRDQCKTAGVAFFSKQLGARAIDDRTCSREWPKPLIQGADAARWSACLEDRAGADPAEWPADMRVQEFPAWPPR